MLIYVYLTHIYQEYAFFSYLFNQIEINEKEMYLGKLTLPELFSQSCSKFKNNLSLNFVQTGK